MNMTRLYDRIRSEINSEKHLTETQKVLFKSILIQCFADQQKEEFDEFCQEQRSFNVTLDMGIAQLELTNKETKNN